MKNKLDELNDDELDASYEAYKTLLETGITKAQALSRTGLTAQMVKDYEAEMVDTDDEDDDDEDEDDLGYNEEATEEWDEKEDDFEDDSKWSEEDVDDEDFDADDNEGDGGYDDGF